MKNLLYILIFIPSLLFSQETKNMELVGVWSSHSEIATNTGGHSFSVDTGTILKITSYSIYSPATGTFHLKLDDEFICLVSSNTNFKSPMPIWIGEGEHTLDYSSGSTSFISATLYGLEFKLTTP